MPALPILNVLLHSGSDVGIFAGLLHPILGLDHLLAMIAVGLLSAQLGGRAIWTVPLTFVGVMALGGIVGLLGIPVPFVEIGIALSVIALGIALILRGNLPVSLAMGLVGLFAIFHGHAHGTELPELSDTIIDIIAYVFGFLLATSGLHLVGALVGQIAESRDSWSNILRVSGAAIAIAGVLIVTGVL